jgi:hypothetical protein
MFFSDCGCRPVSGAIGRFFESSGGLFAAAHVFRQSTGYVGYRTLLRLQGALAMDEDWLDHDMLVKKSLECRQLAGDAQTPDEQSRWIKMADQFLARAQELED